MLGFFIAERGTIMLQSEKVKKAIEAVEACCGKCEICSPDCPVFVAKRALSTLLADLEEYEASLSEDVP
ncbi:hypothetical protein [Selenomonas sputigena]|nr:hypothetical protein [Selenomonas sputigena]UZE44714.1 hypothetical protein OL236_08880 [Selenomonas sputigena]